MIASSARVEVWVSPSGSMILSRSTVRHGLPYSTSRIRPTTTQAALEYEYRLPGRNICLDRASSPT